jgi:hypothetical protein
MPLCAKVEDLFGGAGVQHLIVVPSPEQVVTPDCTAGPTGRGTVRGVVCGARSRFHHLLVVLSRLARHEDGEVTEGATMMRARSTVCGVTRAPRLESGIEHARVSKCRAIALHRLDEGPTALKEDLQLQLGQYPVVLRECGRPVVAF